jgi:hypothetical protein
VLDGFEVPWLRRLVGEGLKVGDEASTEITPVIDAWSKCRHSTRVLLSSGMMSVLGRGVVLVVPRPSPGGAASRSRCRLSPGGLTPGWDVVVPIVLFPATDLALMSSFTRSVVGAPCVPPTVDGVS